MGDLTLIKGVVQNLQISKRYEDFVFTATDKNVAGVAAVGAAAMGQLFNSAALASASGGADISVDCFTCTVNNTLLAGRFHEVQFKEDDEVEFVIEKTGHGGVVHAARSPSKRLLWMLPHQMRGYVAQKRNDWKWTFILSFSLTFLFSIFIWWYSPAGRPDTISDFLIEFSIGFFILFCVNVWARSRLHGHSIPATAVIKALGYNNPEKVDLPALSKLAGKRIEQQTGQRLAILRPWSFWY